MNDDHLINPELRSTCPNGETEVPPPIGGARFATTVAIDGSRNRGRRAGMMKTGEVVGSGAGAGGRGGYKEFDSDSAGGEKQPDLPLEHAPSAKAENSNT